MWLSRHAISPGSGALTVVVPLPESGVDASGADAGPMPAATTGGAVVAAAALTLRSAIDEDARALLRGLGFPFGVDGRREEF